MARKHKKPKTRRDAAREKPVRRGKSVVAVLTLESIEQQSKNAGLSLRVTQIKAKRLNTHWMWNYPGLGRIMNWWPNTGYWNGCGQNGQVDTPDEALRMAIQLVQAVQNGMSRMAIRV